MVCCLLKINEKKFASGVDVYDKSIQIWTIPEFKCINTLQGHNYTVRSMRKINESKILSASRDKTIRLWNID